MFFIQHMKIMVSSFFTHYLYRLRDFLFIEFKIFFLKFFTKFNSFLYLDKKPNFQILLHKKTNLLILAHRS